MSTSPPDVWFIVCFVQTLPHKDPQLLSNNLKKEAPRFCSCHVHHEDAHRDDDDKHRGCAIASLGKAIFEPHSRETDPPGLGGLRALFRVKQGILLGHRR